MTYTWTVATIEIIGVISYLDTLSADGDEIFAILTADGGQGFVHVISRRVA